MSRCGKIRAAAKARNACSECGKPMPRDVAGIVLHQVDHSITREREHVASMNRWQRWWYFNEDALLDALPWAIVIAAHAVFLASLAIYALGNMAS